MADIQKQYGLFIDGDFVPAGDGATFAAHNPANGEELALFAEATKEDVDKAVKALAQRSWPGRTHPLSKDRIFF